MIALLGPPPQTFIDQEQSWNKVKWGNAIRNSRGEPWRTAREFFGGPFFDSKGEQSGQ